MSADQRCHLQLPVSKIKAKSHQERKSKRCILCETGNGTAADRCEDRPSISCCCCCLCIGHCLSPMAKRPHRANENRCNKEAAPICTISFISTRSYLSVLYSLWRHVAKSELVRVSWKHLRLRRCYNNSWSLKGISQNNQCCTSALGLFTPSTQGLSNAPVLAGLQWKL